MQSDIVSGLVEVGVRPSLPIEGISLILGNDLAGGKVTVDPCMSCQPESHDGTQEEVTIYPACAVTHTMKKKAAEKDRVIISPVLTRVGLPEVSGSVTNDLEEESKDSNENDSLVPLDLSETFMAHEPKLASNLGSENPPVQQTLPSNTNVMTQSTLIHLQENDPSLSGVREQAVSETEATARAVCYYKKDGILVRKWSPLDMPADDEWRAVHQIVVPEQYQTEVLHLAQGTMKSWYDRHAKSQSFDVGDEVLVLLPILHNSLQAKYSGPYTVCKKLNDVDYIIDTPGRRKQQRLCHINMMKLYQRRSHNDTISKSCAAIATTLVEGERDRAENGPKFSNSEILKNLGTKLNHLTTEEKAEMEQLLKEFKQVFSDVPKCTTCVCHDVKVGEANPIKQHPYRLNPIKLE